MAGNLLHHVPVPSVVEVLVECAAVRRPPALLPQRSGLSTMPRFSLPQTPWQNRSHHLAELRLLCEAHPAITRSHKCSPPCVKDVR